LQGIFDFLPKKLAFFRTQASWLALAGLLVAGAARAEIPAAGFSFQKEGHEISGAMLVLEDAEDVRELVEGFGAEVRKARAGNPDVKVAVHWVDAVPVSADRGLASGDGSEDIARGISESVPGVEVDGHRIRIPELAESAQGLTDAQLRYVRNADRFVWIMRIGVVGSVEFIHLFVTHHVPAWIPIGAGLATMSAMLFNVINTERITNAVNYMKWKSLTDSEMASINQRIAGMSRFRKLLELPRIYFFSFLYEVAFQGSLQAVIHGLFHAGGVPLPFFPDKFFGSIVVGNFGETAFDLAQGSYQETRAGKVHELIRRANMRMISAVGSILSVGGILMSSRAVEVGYWSLGAMVGTGLGLTVYYRYTDPIQAVTLPVISAGRARMSAFFGSIGQYLKKNGSAICQALLKPPSR
jgi:hypothetical protein